MNDLSQIIDPGLANLLINFLGLVYYSALFLSIVMLIYMGFIYITKSEEGAKKVHKMMPLFIVGLVLVFLSLTIRKLIQLFLFK